MKVIGLIGGCGTGKSQVAMLLKKHYNAFSIIADGIGHDMILQGLPGYAKVVEHFGKKILDEAGQINRKLLGDIVFNDDQELETLNHIMHPLMYNQIKSQIEEIRANKLYDLVILEAAVMLEAGFSDFVDALWFITCPIDKRIERLMSYRSMSYEKIKIIMSKQRSEEEFRKYAQVIIDNGHDMAHTMLQIHLEINKMLEEDHEK